MTEQTAEGGKEVVNQELPTPKFTEPSSDSATSGVDTEALAKKVAELLRPDIAKTVQSTKDKRFAKIEKELGLSELEEMGATIPDNVKLEYRLRKLETQETPVQQPSRQGGGPNNDEVIQVIKEAEIDANTPEGIALLSGQYRNLDHFRSEAYKLKLRLSSKPTPDVSAAPPLSGGAPVPPADLQKKYDEEISHVHGAQKVLEVKLKYRKLGLDVN